MKNKLPTAEEFLLKDENYEELHLDYPKLSKAIQESMIEFAKMHVEQALKAAAENAELDYEKGSCRECGSNMINENSILNSYSLNNIK